MEGGEGYLIGTPAIFAKYILLFKFKELENLVTLSL